MKFTVTQANFNKMSDKLKRTKSILVFAAWLTIHHHIRHFFGHLISDLHLLLLLLLYAENNG